MHLMVDIETLGKSAYAPVIEIAVVKFDNEKIVHMFTSKVKPDFSRSTPDASTIEWWIRQYTRCPIDNSAPLFPKVLVQLEEWLGMTPFGGVWANAPSFDLVILEHLAQAYKVTMPWGFRLYRDVRTFGEIGKALGIPRPTPVTSHVAIDDAIVQAGWVIAINKQLSVSIL